MILGVLGGGPGTLKILENWGLKWMFSSVNNTFYYMSRVSLGSSGGPRTPGPQGVTRSKRTLGWGKSGFLSVFHSYIILFTEQNAIFRDFVISFFQCWRFDNVKIIIMHMGGVNSFILLFTEQIIVFIYVVSSRFDC